jgi:hypothetical protein
MYATLVGSFRIRYLILILLFCFANIKITVSLTFGKDIDARAAAVRALQRVLKTVTTARMARILTFLERFKTRILEMALYECDSGLRLEVVQTLVPWWSE